MEFRCHISRDGIILIKSPLETVLAIDGENCEALTSVSPDSRYHVPDDAQVFIYVRKSKVFVAKQILDGHAIAHKRIRI